MLLGVPAMFALRLICLSVVASMVALLCACGPIRSTVVLIQAERGLQEARALGSAELAPYPTEMSARLIAKAKEEQGYSSFDTATVLAEDARKLAGDALRLAKEASSPRSADELQVDSVTDDSAGDDDDSAGDDDDSAAEGEAQP